MNRRDFLKLMLGAGAASILPLEAIEAMAVRPFGTDWGDCSGSARYGDYLMFRPVDRERGFAFDLAKRGLRQHVEAIERKGEVVRGWRWIEKRPGSSGAIDPLETRGSIGVKIYIEGW